MLTHAYAQSLQEKAKALEGQQDHEKAKKMTGKQWFLQDKIPAYKEPNQNPEVRVASAQGEGELLIK